MIGTMIFKNLPKNLVSIARAQLFFLFCFLPFIKQHPVVLVGFASFLLLLPWIFQNVGKSLVTIVRVLTLAVSCAIIYTQYSSLRGLEPGLGLLSLVTLIKVLELNDKRDHYLFYFMSVVMLIGHLLVVDSLMAVFYILFISIYLFSLMMFSFDLKNEALRSKKMIFDLVLIFLISVPQAFLLFFIFPRFYVGGYSFGGEKDRSQVGFTERLRPGEFSETVLDKTPLFRVRFLETDQVHGRDLYWRGAVLQSNAGFNWDVGAVPDQQEWAAKEEQSYKQDRYYQVDYTFNEKYRVFSLPRTYELKLTHAGQVNKGPGEIYHASGVHHHRLRYEGKTATEVPVVDLTEIEQRLYIQVPETISERMKTWVSDFSEQQAGARAHIDALMRYYRTNNYVYTLAPGEYGGQYPEDDFFFNRRRGFCEHYAATTALILRLLKIPTRVVTGFQGGIYNPVGEFFTIRGEDAHAWLESYIDGEGWVTVDPIRAIAPKRIEFGAYPYFMSLFEGEENLDSILDAQNSSIFNRMIFAFDALYYRANLFFINYQADEQKALFFRLKLDQILGLKPVLWLLITALLLFLISLLYLPLFLWSKDQAQVWEKEFSKACDSLEKITGLKKSPSEAAERYFFRTKPLLSTSIQELFENILDHYLLLQYSATRQMSSITSLKSQVKELSKLAADKKNSKKMVLSETTR